MKKRVVATMMTAVLAATTIGGFCTTASASEEKVKLTYSYWGNTKQLDTRQAMIDKFVETHPNYEIEPIFTDGSTYATKLQTFFAANDAPDVMAIAADTSTDFMKNGMFEDLAPYVEKDGLEDVWFQSMVDSFTMDGHLYGAPHHSVSTCIVYNKDLFDAAGLAYPTDDWTDEDFENAARTLTQGEGYDKVYGMYFNYWVQELIRLYGDYYDMDTLEIHCADNPKMAYIMELCGKLVQDGCAIADRDTSGSTGGGFETGRYGMAFFLSNDAVNYNDTIADAFDWDIVAMPTNAEYGQWTSSLRSDALAISPNCENKDAAWEFVKWMTAEEEPQLLNSELGVPALVSYAQNEYVDTYTEGTINHFDKQKTVDAVNYSKPFGSFGVYGELNDQLFSEQWDLVRFEGKDVETALSDLQAAAEELISSKQ